MPSTKKTFPVGLETQSPFDGGFLTGHGDVKRLDSDFIQKSGERLSRSGLAERVRLTCKTIAGQNSAPITMTSNVSLRFSVRNRSLTTTTASKSIYRTTKQQIRKNCQSHRDYQHLSWIDPTQHDPLVNDVHDDG